MIKEKILELELNQERLNTLMNTGLRSIAPALLVGLFLFSYLKPHVNDFYLSIWIVAVVLISIARISLLFLFRREASLFTAEKWLLYYQTLTCILAFCWSLTSFLMVNNIPPEAEVVPMTILLGLAAGGAISHISVKKTSYFYCFSIVISHTIRIYIEQPVSYHLLIIAEIFFLFLLSKMIFQFNKLYENAVKMTIDLKDKIYIEQELQAEKMHTLQNSKLASLGEMAAGVSHEINNPLTIGIGKLEVMKLHLSKGERPIEFYKDVVDNALVALRRVGKIVKSMKNLSRIQEDVEFQEFTIQDLVENVTPLIEAKLEMNDIIFDNSSEPYPLYADQGEISQVLLNLILNSIDAIKERPVEKWIRLSSADLGDMIEIRVMDSGSNEAIDPDKIFEPFYTTKEVGEGTGLGLSLSTSIMQRNEGSIAIDTSIKNTCFILRIKKPSSAA